jgi:hypothetical protein
MQQFLRELINLTKYTNKKNTKQIQTLGPFSNNRKSRNQTTKPPKIFSKTLKIRVLFAVLKISESQQWQNQCAEPYETDR